MKKIIGDDVTLFLEKGVYIPTRTIYMGSGVVDEDNGEESGVDAKLAERIIKNLHILDAQTDGKNPIIIIMNNIGGDINHAFGIYDAMKTCRNHITIKVFGHCMSAAAAILQAGDERMMSKNSRMLIHYGTAGVEGHQLDVYKNADEMKRLDKIYIDILLERIKEKHPKYKRSQLTQRIKFDCYLSSDEALELGLIDKIITGDEE